MYIGFISYSFGEHYTWICKNWKEMYEYCKDDIQIEIPETEPENIADVNCFRFEDANDLSSTWISIGKASDYSIQQAKEYLYGNQDNSDILLENDFTHEDWVEFCQ